MDQSVVWQHISLSSFKEKLNDIFQAKNIWSASKPPLLG